MNLLLRIVSGAVLLVVLFAALWVGTPAVAAVVALAVVVAVWEYACLMARIGPGPAPWVLYPLALWLALRLVFPAAYQDVEWPLLAAVTAGLLATVLQRTAFERWLSAVGGSLYLGFSLSFYLALFLWRPADTSHLGLRLVATVLLCVIACDTVAYVAGSAFGRHPFFASISPRKTLEGAVCGAVAAVVVGVAVGPALAGLEAAAAAGMGALIGVAAQGGDLVESAIKRRAGVKESSGLIPGHGGLLDRLDSLVLVGPVVYCFLRLVAF